MQKFSVIFLLLILVLPTTQTLAGTDAPDSSAPQKKTRKTTEKSEGAEKRTEWQKMKSYKTWDANRKEFTSPENYLTPEKNKAPTTGSADKKP